jgi:para-aminobenzoate synthetase component 2
MILVIDNYDSFTFNLVQYIKQLGHDVHVVRNDKCTIEEVEKIMPRAILLSPGPGNPDESGICMTVLEAFYQKIPILGVCLGHQIIGQYFGGSIIKAKEPRHGKISVIRNDERTIFRGLPTAYKVARYHSLVVDYENLPACLEVSALSDEGEIMGMRHKHYPIESVQFHPEAILTEHGLKLLENFFGEAV